MNVNRTLVLMFMILEKKFVLTHSIRDDILDKNNSKDDEV
jgi:hypothetical protein